MTATKNIICKVRIKLLSLARISHPIINNLKIGLRSVQGTLNLGVLDLPGSVNLEITSRRVEFKVTV